MCHGGTKHQQTTRTEHFTQRRTRLRTISPFGNLKFPEGGERLADGVMTRNHGFLQRRRGDFQYSKKILLRPEKREKKFFQRQNGQRQEAEFFFFPLKTHHHRKCHPEKMMADQELNSRDGRNALRCPDNFIIPYPSPCGLLLQHRADKGHY